MKNSQIRGRKERIC